MVQVVLLSACRALRYRDRRVDQQLCCLLLFQYSNLLLHLDLLS